MRKDVDVGITMDGDLLSRPILRGEAVEFDDVGLFEPDSLGLVGTVEGSLEASVRQGGVTVLLALFEGAFVHRGGVGDRSTSKDCGGEAELYVMESSLISDSMGDLVVDLSMQAFDDGSASGSILVEEMLMGVFGIDRRLRLKLMVDLVEDPVEGLCCPSGLDIAELSGECERISVVGCARRMATSLRVIGV